VSELAAHLLGGVDTLYATVGEAAPTFTDDATVVWCYEAGRTFGDLTLSLRELSGESPSQWPVLREVLRSAIENDPSGALTVYALTMVIGPRLLVTWRDARERASEDERAWLDEAARRTVSTLQGAGALGLDPAIADEPTWATAARSLRDRLDEAGFGESFGL